MYGELDNDMDVIAGALMLLGVLAVVVGVPFVVSIGWAIIVDGLIAFGWGVFLSALP